MPWLHPFSSPASWLSPPSPLFLRRRTLMRPMADIFRLRRQHHSSFSQAAGRPDGRTEPNPSLLFLLPAPASQIAAPSFPSVLFNSLQAATTGSCRSLQIGTAAFQICRSLLPFLPFIPSHPPPVGRSVGPPPLLPAGWKDWVRRCSGRSNDSTDGYRRS